MEQETSQSGEMWHNSGFTKGKKALGFTQETFYTSNLLSAVKLTQTESHESGKLKKEIVEIE